MRLIGLIFALLLATAAQAQEKPNTQKDCEQILQAMGEVKIEAKQAKFVDQIQGAVATICKRAIDAEKAVPVPTPTLAAEPEVK